MGRRVDLWFVAYGSLDTLASDDFLSNQFKAASDDSENASSARLLGDADLKRRGLPVPSAAEDPRYVAAETTLLERVRVSATTRSIKTRTAESLVAASILDPRFAGDPEFPNRWRSILRDDAGNRQFGEPHAYGGLGSYVKATRLVEPRGAILIEYHVAYAEPQAWFNGANLLQSKLPILAQTVVRKLRRSLAEYRERLSPQQGLDGLFGRDPQGRPGRTQGRHEKCQQRALDNGRNRPVSLDHPGRGAQVRKPAENR